MIGAFPDLRPDELLYSAAARYQEMFAIPSTASVKRVLWGTANCASVVDMPGRLSHLVDQLPQPAAITPTELLLRHTAYPYYAAFVNRARRELGRVSLLDGDGRYAHTHLGARVNTADEEHLRICLRCSRREALRYGAPYWHRVHQLPGVLVCPEHGIRLRRTAVRGGSAARRSAWRYHPLTEDLVARSTPLDYSKRWHARLRRLARRVQWLLDAMPDAPEPRELHQRHRRLALALGWVRRDGRVTVSDLERAVRAEFGDGLLSRLGTPIGSGRNSWIKRLLTSPRESASPVQHLLMLDLLGADMAACFGSEDTFAAYAGEPDGARRRPVVSEAPCPVRWCDRHEPEVRPPDQPGFAQTQVRCPACGFHYACEGGNKVLRYIMSLGRWEEQVRENAHSGSLSWNEMADALGISGSQLAHQRRTLGLLAPEQPNPAARGARQGGKIRRCRVRSRNWLSRIRRAHPDWIRDQIQRHNPTNYTWLLRQDRAWAERHLPPPQNQLEVAARSFVDWEARDAAWVERVPAIIEALIAEQERPQRISRRQIHQRLRGTPLSTRAQKKLPRTSAAIAAGLAEANGAALTERRIEWAVRHYVARREVPCPANLARSVLVDPGPLREARKRFDLDGTLARIRVGVATALQLPHPPPGRPPSSAGPNAREVPPDSGDHRSSGRGDDAR